MRLQLSHLPPLTNLATLPSRHRQLGRYTSHQSSWYIYGRAMYFVQAYGSVHRQFSCIFLWSTKSFTRLIIGHIYLCISFWLVVHTSQLFRSLSFVGNAFTIFNVVDDWHSNRLITSQSSLAIMTPPSCNLFPTVPTPLTTRYRAD